MMFPPPVRRTRDDRRMGATKKEASWRAPLGHSRARESRRVRRDGGQEDRMPARKSAQSRKGAVGVVGLGIMGGAYARLLARAGWDVVGFDTNAPRRKEAARAGVRILADAKSVAAAAPVIITSLPSPAALESTVTGIIAAGAPRRVLIEAGTFSLADKMKA